MRTEAERFDVVVVGGGSAGLAAAVSAARTGARTLLLERHGFMGGMGTASLVHTFCGLYLLREEEGAVYANPGFASEMAERMMAATGLGPQRMGRVDVLPQHPVEFARIADELVSAERSLTLLLHTEVCGLEESGDGWILKAVGRGGESTFRASALVDASGDAEAARWLGGAQMAEGAALQRPAYVFAVQPVESFGPEQRLEIAGVIVEGVRAGVLSAAAMGASFRTSGRKGEVFGTIDLAAGREGYDPLDPAQLTEVEMQGRRVAASLVAWLKNRLPAWREAYISHWPVRAGVRESRRWLGEALLTGEDLLSSARYGDEVALATWPMEFRENTRGPKLRFPRSGRPAGIRAGCLIPKGQDRLFVAGRCLSADHEAQASIRVMGTCFATGEAAGKMAVARAGR